MRVISEAEAEALPVDLMTMREGMARLLVEGGGAPRPREDLGTLSDEALETLGLQMRGHLEVLVAAVTRAADRRPEGDHARSRALAGVWYAQDHLRMGPGDTRIIRIAVATRLAGVVRTLCGHLENLGGGPPSQGQFVVRMCGHCYEPIEADEEYTTYTPELATTGAPDVYRHARRCRRAPTQTFPVTSRH